MNFPVRFATSVLLVACFSVALLTGCRGEAWPEFKPANGRFSVSMPLQPAEEKKIASTRGGEVIRLVSYTTTTNEITYSITYTDYSDAAMKTVTADEILDAGLNASASGFRQNVVEREVTTLQGHPARRFVIRDPATSYVLNCKSCLVSNRVYVIQLVHPAKIDAAAEAHRFFKSFKLD